MRNIDVIKYDIHQVEQWRYQGVILQKTPSQILIEAYFDRSDIQAGGLLLSRGDRFLEIYFEDRWYNVFEVYAGSSNQKKGWYCNVSKPVVITERSISYIDLALDLVVLPDGQQAVLDEDEFLEIDLDQKQKNKALAALSELQTHFATSADDFSVSNWLK